MVYDGYIINLITKWLTGSVGSYIYIYYKYMDSIKLQAGSK